MLKIVNLFICLSVLMFSDAKIIDCAHKSGTCPPIPFNCNVPLPLVPQPTTCECDFNCNSIYKCCNTFCSNSYRMCLLPNPITTINDNALETNVEDSPLNHIDDNIKKIFEQVQDNITSDKELKQLSNSQENDVQGQKGNKGLQEIKVNVFYNIIKKIYVQNLNIYKGVDKTVDGGNGIINKQNQGCLDDEGCVTTPVPESGLEPQEPEPSSTITSEGSEHVVVTPPPSTAPTKHPENQGCQDDEDCYPNEGSGILFEASGSGINFEGSGNDELQLNNLREEYVQILLPNIPTVPTRYKTIDDGTHHIFFDREVKVIDDAGVIYDVETEIEF